MIVDGVYTVKMNNLGLLFASISLNNPAGHQCCQTVMSIEFRLWHLVTNETEAAAAECEHRLPALAHTVTGLTVSFTRLFIDGFNDRVELFRGRCEFVETVSWEDSSSGG